MNFCWPHTYSFCGFTSCRITVKSNILLAPPLFYHLFPFPAIPLHLSLHFCIHFSAISSLSSTLQFFTHPLSSVIHFLNPCSPILLPLLYRCLLSPLYIYLLQPHVSLFLSPFFYMFLPDSLIPSPTCPYLQTTTPPWFKGLTSLLPPWPSQPPPNDSLPAFILSWPTPFCLHPIFY